MANDGSNYSAAGSSPPKKPTVHIDLSKLPLARGKVNPPAAPVASPPPPAVFKPQPATLPPGSLEAVLHTLVCQHGAQVWESRKTFRNYMADGLAGRISEHQFEINTMGLLLEAGLPTRLLTVRADQFAEFLRREADAITSQHPVSPDYVREAVRCWSAALRPELALPAAAGNLSLSGGTDPFHELLALQQTAAARQAEEERLAREKREADARKLAEQKRLFDTGYPRYLALLDDSHLLPAELVKAWKILGQALGLALPDAPGELAWTATGPEARPRRIRATREQPYINSLGMRFVPVPGTEVLFGIWETRVQDYAAYAAANSGVDASWKNPVYENVPVTPGPTHPVVCVSWDDAQAFAKWLTEKERNEGKLPPGVSYRLPTDAEWSVAVGLQEAPGGTPSDKSGKVAGVYPWGKQWPPPNGAGNFADTCMKAKFPSWGSIDGYTDGYAATSPVGSFAANQSGLFDLSGNVWEWCEDWYNSEQKYRVLRGGSWYVFVPSGLLSSFRSGCAPDFRCDRFGFRLVLVGAGGVR